MPYRPRAEGRIPLATSRRRETIAGGQGGGGAAEIQFHRRALPRGLGVAGARWKPPRWAVLFFFPSFSPFLEFSFFLSILYNN